MENSLEEEALGRIRKMSSIDDNPCLSDNTLDILLENTIKTLSSIINTEFNKNSGSFEESLFCSPDIKDFDLLSKVQLARDLAELLSNCKSKRDTILSNQSIESLRNYRPSSIIFNNKDLLNAILHPGNEDIYLNPFEAEQLLNIINNFSATSETNKYRVPLASNQKEFILISQKIAEMKASMKNKQDEHDFLEISNKKLVDTTNLLIKQEEYLDKQLEDSMVEYFSYEEHKKTLTQELAEANESLIKLLSENSRTKPIKKHNDGGNIPTEENTSANSQTPNPFVLTNKSEKPIV